MTYDLSHITTLAEYPVSLRSVSFSLHVSSSPGLLELYRKLTLNYTGMLAVGLYRPLISEPRDGAVPGTGLAGSDRAHESALTAANLF